MSFPAPYKKEESMKNRKHEDSSQVNGGNLLTENRRFTRMR